MTDFWHPTGYAEPRSLATRAHSSPSCSTSAAKGAETKPHACTTMAWSPRALPQLPGRGVVNLSVADRLTAREDVLDPLVMPGQGVMARPVTSFHVVNRAVISCRYCSAWSRWRAGPEVWGDAAEGAIRRSLLA